MLASWILAADLGPRREHDLHLLGLARGLLGGRLTRRLGRGLYRLLRRCLFHRGRLLLRRLLLLRVLRERAANPKRQHRGRNADRAARRIGRIGFAECHELPLLSWIRWTARNVAGPRTLPTGRPGVDLSGAKYGMSVGRACAGTQARGIAKFGLPERIEHAEAPTGERTCTSCRSLFGAIALLHSGGRGARRAAARHRHARRAGVGGGLPHFPYADPDAPKGGRLTHAIRRHLRQPQPADRARQRRSRTCAAT